ncbi:MAG TPA: creatininase family protein [Trueperaceae bacterium]
MADVLDITDLTWEEVRAHADRGAVALVPTGAVEQHGPHLPLKVDTILVTHVAREAAKKLHRGPVVIVPTLWLGVSAHHTDFFALSMTSSTYIEVIVQLAESLVKGGFRRILFLNGHGGNTDPLKVAVRKVRSAASVVVGTVNYWALAKEQVMRYRDSEAGGISHAGELETSAMMHLEPASVKRDRIEKRIPAWRPPYVLQDLVEPGLVTLGLKWTDLTDNGVLGDPTLATEEKGRHFLRAFVEEVAGLLEVMMDWELRDGSLHLSKP